MKDSFLEKIIRLELNKKYKNKTLFKFKTFLEPFDPKPLIVYNLINKLPQSKQ